MEVLKVVSAALKDKLVPVRRVFVKFGEDQGGILAGAISFYALLSLAPALLLAAAIFAHLLRSPEMAYAQVMHYVSRLSPTLAREQGSGIKELIEELIKGRHVAWGIGAVGLAWAASQIFVTLQAAMNVVWDAEEGRGFFKNRFVAFAVMIIVVVLFVVGLGISTLAAVVRNLELPLLGYRAGDVPFAWDFLAAVAPLVLTFLMFLVIYKVMPNTEVPLRSAALGAAVSALLWEVARWAFGWYGTHFAGFSKVYGSIGAIIVLALWIYYSAVVAILGAEIGAAHRDAAERVDG